MCYDSKARPPEPPGDRIPASGRDLVLTAADGTRFAAYWAQPEGTPRAQVLIFPDVRGLHGFYQDLALRFAERGIGALAIDYFGRSADHFTRDDEFEYMPHVEKMTMQTFLADVDAALNYIRAETSNDKPFVLGFCRGGTLSILVGTQQYNLAGLIPFYAGLGRKVSGADGTALEEAHKVHYPLLGLFGGADQGIPVEQVEQLDGELDKTHVKHEIVIYPGAPHSFFDRHQTKFADESADAWQRVLKFIDANA